MVDLKCTVGFQDRGSHMYLRGLLSKAAIGMLAFSFNIFQPPVHDMYTAVYVVVKFSQRGAWKMPL